MVRGESILKKEKKKIEVEVVYGDKELVECLKNVIKICRKQ